MNNSMINPSIVDLLKKVDNRYSLVITSSKRAKKQIIDGSEVTVKTSSHKPLSIAVEEINEKLFSNLRISRILERSMTMENKCIVLGVFGRNSCI